MEQLREEARDESAGRDPGAVETNAGHKMVK